MLNGSDTYGTIDETTLGFGTTKEQVNPFIFKWLLRGRGSPQSPEVRTFLGELEGWVSVVVNLGLGLGKIFLGVVMNSAGLISDGVHSLGDLATSLVVIIGFRISKKPADPEHPFGHERSEHIATLVIAILLVIAGFEVGKETLSVLLDNPQYGVDQVLTWPIFWILVGAILAKELLARFSTALGRIIGSTALAADGWHHRTDALTTIVVVAGLGGRNLGLPWLDGVAGVGVAVFIVWTGLKMTYDSFSPLLGETVPPGELEQIRDMARKIPSVVDAHDIRVQRYGNFHITTIHIELSDRIDVHRMHHFTVEVEKAVLQRFPGECVVHIDPIDYHHPLFDEVSAALKEAVVGHPYLVNFHDLHLWREKGGEAGNVEVSVEPGAYETASKDLSEYLVGKVEQRFPGLRMEVHLKVDFSATPLEG